MINRSTSPMISILVDHSKACFLKTMQIVSALQNKLSQKYFFQIVIFTNSQTKCLKCLAENPLDWFEETFKMGSTGHCHKCESSVYLMDCVPAGCEQNLNTTAPGYMNWKIFMILVENVIIHLIYSLCKYTTIT